jgi:hypothetical protein
MTGFADLSTEIIHPEGRRPRFLPQTSPKGAELKITDL